MKRVTVLVFLITSFFVAGADPYPKNDAIDILHYTFRLQLNDTTPGFTGKTDITLKVLKTISSFNLDFIKKTSAGKGMEVFHVWQHDKAISFTHENDRLMITLDQPARAGTEVTVVVDYGGIPSDGLIIGKNKFGDRTFFGDNWPNRAHHWLPCIDHPSDKATCEFIITAPEQYQVVSNGKKIEESSMPGHQKLTHWREATPISTKVMVIGIARFAVNEAGVVDGIPVQSWIYPQNRLEGFADFAKAVDALEFMDRHVGPYSYEKLANVQSTTRYGGMENASAIFYAENLVTGKNQYEGVVAHEVAHQWFGNSATEKDWYHVWLSEGFATYMSNLYLESKYGRDALIKSEEADRQQVIEYTKTHSDPVIDTTVTNLMALLNVNSYQKGGWVLHMLRHEVGDQNFWKGVQGYYASYRNSNALTADFQHAMEVASAKDLSGFFKQWLRTGGHPHFSGQWEYDAKSAMVKVTLTQVQKGAPFSVPLDVGIQSADGVVKHTILVTEKTQKFTISAQKKPLDVILDPDTWLLFEGKLTAK